MLRIKPLKNLAQADQMVMPNIRSKQGVLLAIDAELAKIVANESLMRAQLVRHIKPNNVFIETSESRELNVKIKAAILKTPFEQTALNYALHYVNQEVAELLAVHPNPRIKEFGIKSVDYFKETECVVNKVTGMVEAKLSDPEQQTICWSIKVNRWQNKNTAWADVNAPWTLKNEEETPEDKFFYKLRKENKFLSSAPKDWDLIPPDCVAAMLGDIDMLEMLHNKGRKLGVCPAKKYRHTLEFAVMFSQEKVVQFLLANHIFPEYHSQLDNIFKLAIESGNLTIIDLLSHTCEVTTGAIALGKSMHPLLGAYLELKKTMFVCRNFRSSPLSNLVGEYAHTEDEFLIHFICTFPRVVNHQIDKEGNTFLHRLISGHAYKKVDKIKQYLSAIRSAKCVKDIPFDVELKNNEGKSLLKLAFETGEKDIVVALLIYAIPSIKDFETEINQANILMSDISLERDALNRKITEKNAQMLLSQMQVLQQTNMNVGELAMAQEGMHQVLNQVVNVVASNPQINSGRGSNQRMMMFPPVKAITNNDDDDNSVDLTSVLAELKQLKREMTAMQQRMAVLEEKLPSDMKNQPR